MTDSALRFRDGADNEKIKDKLLYSNILHLKVICGDSPFNPL